MACFMLLWYMQKYFNKLVLFLKKVSFLNLRIEFAHRACDLNLQVELASWSWKLSLQVEVATWSCELNLKFELGKWIIIFGIFNLPKFLRISLTLISTPLPLLIIKVSFSINVLLNTCSYYSGMVICGSFWSI